MKKLTEQYIVIKNPIIAAMFSGCDVWIIPIKHKRRTAFTEYEPDRSKTVYLGDDWTICNEMIFGYNREPCWIAVTKPEWFSAYESLPMNKRRDRKIKRSIKKSLTRQAT